MKSSIVPVLSLVACISLAAGRGRAQGADACASAQPIAGFGTFAFDNTAATTDGLPDNLCLAFGTAQIEEDVWWIWTAPGSGVVAINTCSQTTVDTRLAVYDGSCAGTVLACNDDTCSLQSTIQFVATGGNPYVISLGDYPGSAPPGTGTMTIASVPPPAIEVTAVSPVNGHTYHQLAPASWTLAEQTAVSMGGHLATVRSQAEHDWLNATFHIYQGNAIDLWIGFNDAAVEGTFVWSSGEPVVYTNWDVGEPNNAGGIEDYTIMRKNNPNAYWNDLNNTGGSFHNAMHGIVEIGSSAFTSYCFGDGTGPACPCGNNGTAGRGCNTSAATGGAQLAASGTTSPDTVVLTSSGELPTVLSIFLQGDNTISQVPFGDGLRCVAGILKRLYVKNASGGAVSAPAIGDPSITVRSAQLGDTIPAGGTRYYQVYYRDPNTGWCPSLTFNVTNGVRIGW